MRVLRVAALSGVCLGFAACATVTRGTSEAWVVTSEPPGAAVHTTNGFACDQTPCTFKMSRKADFTATISKPGFVTVNTHVTNQISPGGGLGMAGNVVLGGIVGAGVDAFSGAMLSITPNPLNVKLEHDGKAVASLENSNAEH